MKYCECYNYYLNIYELNIRNISISYYVENGFLTCSLDIHCMYSLDQVLAPFGYWNAQQSPAFREGVKYFADEQTDIFFITLNKSDKDFSPSTLYEDYAINERYSTGRHRAGCRSKRLPHRGTFITARQATGSCCSCVSIRRSITIRLHLFSWAKQIM